MSILYSGSISVLSLFSSMRLVTLSSSGPVSGDMCINASGVTFSKRLVCLLSVGDLTIGICSLFKGHLASMGGAKEKPKRFLVTSRVVCGSSLKLVRVLGPVNGVLHCRPNAVGFRSRLGCVNGRLGTARGFYGSTRGCVLCATANRSGV